MVPVPRKAGAQLTLATARGVLAGSHPGKAAGRAARQALAPLLKTAAGDEQQGAIEHGGTEFASHTIKLLFRRARITGRCLAVLFVDLKSKLSL